MCEYFNQAANKAKKRVRRDPDHRPATERCPNCPMSAYAFTPIDSDQLYFFDHPTEEDRWVQLRSKLASIAFSFRQQYLNGPKVRARLNVSAPPPECGIKNGDIV